MSRLHSSPSVTVPPMFVQDPESRTPPQYNNSYSYESIEMRSNRDHLMRVVLLGLRGLASLFSFLCFVIILTVNDFNKADTYIYVLAVTSLSIVYNVVQTAKGLDELANSRELMSSDRVSALVDFVGDQVVSYMVLSGASAGIAATNEGRQLAEEWKFLKGGSQEYDKAAAATSMLFFAFLALVFPTLLSFHRLSQTFTSA